jgi:hypothetical protein
MSHTQKKKGVLSAFLVFSTLALAAVISITVAPKQVSATCYYGPGVGDYSTYNYAPGSASINVSASGSTLSISGTLTSYSYLWTNCNDGVSMDPSTGQYHTGVYEENSGSSPISNATLTVNGTEYPVSISYIGGGSGSAYGYSFSATVEAPVSSSYTATISAQYDNPETYYYPNYYGGSSAETGVSASKSVSGPSTGTITVSSCPEGGSFTLSGNGQSYTSSPATVQPGTYSLSYNPPTNYTYDISPASSQSVAAGGSASFTVTCHPAQVVVNLTVNPSSLTCGQTSTLSWSSNGANSCTNNFNSSTAVSGSAIVSPTATTDYTVTCTGGAQTASDTKTIAVSGQCIPPSDPVTLDMSASPTLVNSGETSTISWSAPAATRCDAISPAGWTSKTSNSGSQVVTVTATTTYSMNCSNATDSDNGTAIVNVRPASYAWISVNSNLSNSVWALNPGNATGYGTGMKTPLVTSPTLFTLTPSAVTGYTYAVSNSDGGASSMTVSPGDSKSFTITYSPDNNSFNYTLTNSGDITIQKPASSVTRTETIYKRKVGGSGAPTGTVSVDADSVPAGVSIAYQNRNCSPDCDTTITLTIDSSVAVGTHPITVNGSPQSQSTTFNLIVENSSAPVVSCTPSVSSAKVGDTVTWTGGVSGGTAPFTYRWSGSGIPTSPAPATQNYNMKYTTVGTKTATLQVTDANGQVGSCTPPGSVRVDFNPTFQEF